MHQPWYNLAGSSPKMNPQGNPEELISYVEGAVDMLKLRGVFFGGGHANQVILPNGPYGTLHVGAGGGGASRRPVPVAIWYGSRNDAKG